MRILLVIIPLLTACAFHAAAWPPELAVAVGDAQACPGDGAERTCAAQGGALSVPFLDVVGDLIAGVAGVFLPGAAPAPAAARACEETRRPPEVK